MGIPLLPTKAASSPNQAATPKGARIVLRKAVNKYSLRQPVGARNASR